MWIIHSPYYYPTYIFQMKLLDVKFSSHHKYLLTWFFYQVFVFVTAEYENSKNSLNQVCYLFDSGQHLVSASSCMFQEQITYCNQLLLDIRSIPFVTLGWITVLTWGVIPNLAKTCHIIWSRGSTLFFFPGWKTTEGLNSRKMSSLVINTLALAS
jgi:hypothetical protein